MADLQTPRTPSLSAQQPEDGRISLADYLHSDAFRQAAGLTGEGERRLLSDDDGQPLLLWHGSSARFDKFDFARAGENTGLVEYYDKNRDEKVIGDSAGTMFFTDNREAAVSYTFLSRFDRLSDIATYLTDLRVLLRRAGGTPDYIIQAVHGLDDLKKAFAILKEEGDRELDAILDEIDLTVERPISRLDSVRRDALLSRLDPLLKKYRSYREMNRSGGLSNRLNNFVKMKSYLEYFERNISRLRNNDVSVHTEFNSDFTDHIQMFYGPDGNSNVFVSFDPDEKRMKVNGRHLDEMSDADIGSLLTGIKRDLNANIRSFNRDIEDAGFLKNTVLYPVVLKANNPLIHDYRGSSFPDKYKPNEKYPTAYIAARQVRKAREDGNDAVVYQNIRDPFDQTTYGVFSADQIHIIPDHVQGLDRSPLIEEIDERPLREQQKNINEVNIMTQEQIIDADKILKNFKSDEERIRAGWVSLLEMERFNISKDRVVGLLNEAPFRINGEWPNLIYIRNSIIILEGESASLPQCQRVGEGVYVHENASLDLPQCQSVGGPVFVDKNASLDLPQCQSVGGPVFVCENASLDLPQCQSVGATVFVHENASLDLPQCQSVGEGVCDSLFGEPLPQYKDIKPDSFYFNCLKRDISLKIINPFMFVIRNEDDRRYLDRIMEMKADPQRVVDFRLEDQKAFLNEMCSAIGDKIHAAGLPDDLSVTDVKVSSLPYADGKPLCECPGWGEQQSDYGRVESVTICDGNGHKSVFSGNMIDEEGNITLEVNNASVTINLKTGRAETTLKPSGVLANKPQISQSQGKGTHV